MLLTDGRDRHLRLLVVRAAKPEAFFPGPGALYPRIDWKRSVELKPLQLFNHADAPRRLPSVSRYRMWSGGMPVFFERWLYSAA